MKLSNRTLVLLTVFIVLLLGGIKIVQSYINLHTGTVTVVINLTDASGSTIQIDGQPAASQPDRSYKLRDGQHRIQVTKPGYKDFSGVVTVVGNKSTIVNAQLSLTTNPILTSLQQVSVIGFDTSSYQITKIDYFDDKLWAIIGIGGINTDPATIVIKYDAAKGHWQSILGPGTHFYAADKNGLPPDIVEILVKRGLIEEG